MLCRFHRQTAVCHPHRSRLFVRLDLQVKGTPEIHRRQTGHDPLPVHLAGEGDSVGVQGGTVVMDMDLLEPAAQGRDGGIGITAGGIGVTDVPADTDAEIICQGDDLFRLLRSAGAGRL